MKKSDHNNSSRFAVTAGNTSSRAKRTERKGIKILKRIILVMLLLAAANTNSYGQKCLGRLIGTIAVKAIIGYNNQTEVHKKLELPYTPSIISKKYVTAPSVFNQKQKLQDIKIESLTSAVFNERIKYEYYRNNGTVPVKEILEKHLASSGIEWDAKDIGTLAKEIESEIKQEKNRKKNK